MSDKKGLTARRDFLKLTSGAALGLAVNSVSPALARVVSAFELIIRNGLVLDGTGAPAFRADVGIMGDVIAAVGEIPAGAQGRVLDAEGWIVAPGFIDIHTHSDDTILEYPTADSRVMQGVTTEVTGNCGGSAAPRRKSETGGRGDDDWTDVAGYLDALDRKGIALNHAFLVGHGTLRPEKAGREIRELTPEEMSLLERRVEESLDQGAFGVSTGLEYVPGRFSSTEELIRIARVVARYGGFYASHIRNEEARLLEAVSEAIRIGRESGARVQISHLKAAGRRNWPSQGAALELIESGRQRGVDVLADVYPYTAYATGLTIFIPNWALKGGWNAFKQRLKNDSDRQRIAEEIDEQIRDDPGEYRLIVINRVRSEALRPLVGRNLEEVAESWQISPVEAVLRLLAEEGNVGFIGHGMSPENVEMVIRHPLTMIGSDGSSISPSASADGSNPHPRYYGTFARVLSHYVRERGVLSLADAVRKMTSFPADQIGLADRGRIATGKKADLVVFHPDRVKDRATFQSPHQFPVGIRHVLVNGRLVVEDEKHTGRRPGCALRRV